jgi:hypothetical protein
MPTDDKWIVGRVARMDGHNTIYAYFFPPLRDDPPEAASLASQSAGDAFTQARFSDLGTRRGEWRLLGHTDEFDAAQWPMVEFERLLEPSGMEPRLFAIRWSDEDPNVETESRRVDIAEAGSRPRSGLHGAKAVVIAVRKRLDALTA